MEAVAAEWLAASAPDAVLIDLTTNAPETVRRVGARIAAAGRHLLEAPLTGGAPGAKARMLTFIVGGDAAVFERCRPLLATIGRAAFHLGPLGTGNVGKLVNSLFAFTTTWVSLEGLAVCAKSGIDLRTMVEMVRAGGGGNFFIDRMVEGINERGRPTDFALDLAAKDAGLLLDVARELGVPTPVAAEVAQALVAAKAFGLGGRDFTEIVEVAERLAGVKLHLAPPRATLSVAARCRRSRGPARRPRRRAAPARASSCSPSRGQRVAVGARLDQCRGAHLGEARVQDGRRAPRRSSRAARGR